MVFFAFLFAVVSLLFSLLWCFCFSVRCGVFALQSAVVFVAVQSAVVFFAFQSDVVFLLFSLLWLFLLFSLLWCFLLFSLLWCFCFSIWCGGFGFSVCCGVFAFQTAVVFFAFQSAMATPFIQKPHRHKKATTMAPAAETTEEVKNGIHGRSIKKVGSHTMGPRIVLLQYI